MRILPLGVLAIVVAGCLGAPEPRQGSATPLRVEGDSLRVLVTNDELVPISGVVAFVDNRPRPATGDELGELVLTDLAPGRHNLRLWAPQHYRAMENFTFDPSAENATLRLVLQRRPDDRVMPELRIVQGQCFLALRSGQGMGDMGCMAKPSSERYPPPPSVRFSLTNKTEAGTLQRFHNVSVRFQWAAEDVEQLPVLEARMEPDGTFPDGRKVIVFDGKGPFEFHLEAKDLDPALLDGRHALRLAPVPADDGQPRTLFAVDFRVDAFVGTLYSAPPNPAWPR